MEKALLTRGSAFMGMLDADEIPQKDVTLRRAIRTTFSAASICHRHDHRRGAAERRDGTYG
jgi:hypothetical protein